MRRLLLLLVVLQLVLGGWTAASKTVTHDEIWHLPVGLLSWRTGTFDGDVLNPPLTRMWAAIPAAAAGVEVWPGVDGTDVARKFVFGHREGVIRWYVWGRVMNLLCCTAAGLLLVRWAVEWWGATGGWIAGMLYFTCPNILAHGSLVTPDTGLMLGFVATLYAFARWRSARSWGWTVALGIVLGLTQATKFTAVLLYLLLPLIWLAGGEPLPSESPGAAGPQRVWRRALAQIAVVGAISLLVWNACFLFRGTGRPLARYDLQSRALQGLRTIAGPLANAPLPLPADYVIGLDRQRAVMEQPHPCFLDGRWNVTGFPDYFVRTLAYKLPHVTQFCVVAGLLILTFGGGVNDRRGRWLILLLPTAALLGIASFSSMQLGVRYVLPVLPLLMLGAAAAGPWLDRRSPRLRTGILAAGTLLALASLRHHPHHLTYFNELSGGPIGGRQHLLDSNLDWGQDLHLVKAFMTQQGLDRIGLVYFGTYPAELLGIDFEISPGFTPGPGWHAVSVNFVMGRPHLLREQDGRSRAADIGEFAYFQRFEPVARLGNSIDVYHLEQAPGGGIE